MMQLPFATRSEITRKVTEAGTRSALVILDRLLSAGHDWQRRCAQSGRTVCAEEISTHFLFLAGALEAGSPASFVHYVQWAGRMLQARGIAPRMIQQALEEIGRHLVTVLAEPEYALVASYLQAAAGAASQDAFDAETPGTGNGLLRTRDIFLAAILSGQRQAALRAVMDACQAGFALTDIYVEVFGKALGEVGALWECNRISVAQEHMATAIAQYAIANLYPHIVPRGPQRGSMVVTGVAGELHQIGANLVADAMESEGWDVHFLGTNLPDSEILAALRENEVEVLCVSTTLLSNLPASAELIRAVRSTLNSKAPRIVVGGAAFRLAPELAVELEVTNCGNDLRGALNLLCA